MGEPTKPKLDKAELGCTVIPAAILAFLLIGAAYEHFHPDPPMTPAERAEFWQKLLANETKHARECEENLDNARKAVPDMLKSDRDWGDVRRSCWDDWRDLQRRALDDQQ